jgi:tripartite-type tricarboxylate transporter receptor subunit TctC
MGINRRTLLGGAAAILPLAGARAQGEAWPSRPIRVVVPYSPGGGADVFARVLAEGLRQSLGQPVVIENRAGANGVVGSQQVTSAAGDGYTLAVLTGTHIINRYAMGTLPFDPVKDFIPVAKLCQYPYVLASSAAAPFQDVQQLIAYARANPKAVGFGSSEAATSFAGNEFARRAGVQMEEVAYRGGAPLMNDIVAGILPTGWTSTLSVGPYTTNDRIRVLAVSTTKRSPVLPNVPTLNEAGVPGGDLAGWYGLFGPPSLSPEIAARLHRAVTQALNEPARRTRLAEMGADLTTLGPREFASFIQEDDAQWARAAAAGHVAKLQ